MENLFASESHNNYWLDDFAHGLAVQANQYMIVHNGEAIILDPGGHKAYKTTIPQVASLIPLGNLKHIFLSHQDPDIVAALNGWLMTTNAQALCSELWLRFLPHFGLDTLMEERLQGIPDEGQILDLNGANLLIIPAHFLHSVGNFQIYDPTAKILYSGDLGASMGMNYRFVEDFENHLQYMEDFHKRYMTCNKAMRAWARMVSALDIEVIAPQHGAAFKGTAMVKRFIQWCEELECGIDVMESVFTLPEA